MATAFGRAIRVHVPRRCPAATPRWMSQVQGSPVKEVVQPMEEGTELAEGPKPDHHVHVRLSYLLSSTKVPPDNINRGDLTTGRIRPTPCYVPLSRHVFETQPRRDLLHAAVVYYLDSRRSGTASTKSRGQVSFSGAKIRPQKGTGQARLGTRSNPIMRKGGVAHGPKPRDMSSKLNRRVREFALRSALSAKWQQGDLVVVKSLEWIPPPRSTGVLRKLLQSKRWEDSLFLTAPRHPSSMTTSKLNPKPSAMDPIYTEEQTDSHGAHLKDFIKAMNNIPKVEAIRLDKLKSEADEELKKPEDKKRPGELHAYHILKRKKLICDLGAIEWLEEKLGGAIFHAEDVAQMAKDLTELEEEGQRALASEDEGEEIAEDIMEEADRVVGQIQNSRDEEGSIGKQ